jgi:hypothetical protein
MGITLVSGVFHIAHSHPICNAMTEKLLGEVYPVQSVLRLYKEDQLPIAYTTKSHVKAGGIPPL